MNVMFLKQCVCWTEQDIGVYISVSPSTKNHNWDKINKENKSDIQIVTHYI